MFTDEELQDGFYVGDWEVLPGKGQLCRGGEVKKPEPKVFAVLMALARRNSNLVTYQELIDEVWGGRPTADEPITRCISQLRRVFDDHPPYKYVENIQRRGYRLKKTVTLNGPWWTSLRFKQAVVAIVAIGFIGMIVDISSPDGPDDVAAPPPPRSIAVMPFENLTGEVSNEYLVLGFKEELVQALRALDDYTVKNIRGVPADPRLKKIAEDFGVSKVLLGVLRRDGNVLKISYQIAEGDEVANGGEIEGSLDKLFDLQESLALMVRENLVGKSAQVLIKSRPSDSAAYDSYLKGMLALEHRGDPGNLEKAVDLFDIAIELDPNYGPSYLALATVYTLMSTYRDEPVEKMDQLALDAIAAGVSADPAIEDAAGAIYGYVYKNQKRWKEAENAYRRAVGANAVDSNAFNWYSRMLASVGRLDESLTQILAALEIDPTSPVVNSRTAMSYAWVGENQKALEYYERANKLGWNGPTHILGYAFILIQTGQIDKARNLATGAVQMAGAATDWIDPVFDAFVDQDKAGVALDALNDFVAVESISPIIELTVRTLLGDLDGAMRVAELLEAPGEAFEMDMLFIPELAPLRRHPEFLPLLDRLKITAYWSMNDCIWSGDRVTCSP